MGHDVLSSEEYQNVDQGYVVDNGPWQEKIKRSTQDASASSVISGGPWPTLGVEEFKPDFLPENPEAESVAPLDPIAMAEERAKQIELSAKKNAFDVVEKARWEADEILHTAKDEAEREAVSIRDAASEQGHKEGFEQGKQDGFVQGEVEGRNAYSSEIATLDSLMKNLTEERKKLIGDLQPMLVELVGSALQRCLKKEAANGDLVLGFVNEALQKAQDKVQLRLRLNPEDMEQVETKRKELQLSVGAGDMELIADARIERGGCVLETESGMVDVRLSTVVEQVKESLTSEMKK